MIDWSFSRFDTSFGWCAKCRERTGHRRFRELIDGYCRECCMRYSIQAGLPKIEEINVAAVTPKLATIPNKKQPTQKVKVKPISDKKIANLEEEKEMLKALEILQLNAHWRQALCNYLDWPFDKVRRVSRRLIAKGVKIPQISMKDLVIKLLKEKPNSTQRELARKMPIKKDQVYQILLELLKEDKVTVHREFYRNKPNRYSIKDL